MNNCNEHWYKDDVRFSYDSLSRKVTFYLKTNAEVMLNDMVYMLGFSPKQIISKTTTGHKQVDLEYGSHDLFVRCLSSLVNLTCVLNMYLLSRKQFETIQVNIKRDTGESVQFEFGRVLLTLHFRQSQT